MAVRTTPMGDLMTGVNVLGWRSTRRQFLVGACAAGVATALVGCDNIPPSPDPAPLPKPPDSNSVGFFDAMAELREAVRGSPDHLVAAAAAAVAAKDAEALFRLVRDRVATYPAGSRSTGDLVRGIRWGTRATLRGGAGTPREKADLLAELCVEAGYEAEVVRVAVTSDGSARMFEPLRRPVFEPAIERSRLAIVRRSLGLTEAVTVPPPLDPGGTNSKSLANQLLRLLPAQPQAQEPFSVAAVSALPMVRVVRGGDTLLADPTGDLGFAPLGARGYGNPQAAEGLLDIEVLVEAARSDAPDRRFTLVRGQWSAADVAGRRLYVGFVPPAESLEEFTAIRPRDVGVVVPVLTVRGNEMEPEESRALSVQGTPVTLGGQLVDIGSADGKTRIDGEVVGAAGTDPTVVARVASVEISIRAAGFPTIDAALRVVDGDGRMVEGLSAAAFQIVEEGTPVGHTLTRSIAPPPRILILLDGSGSIPEEFRESGAAVVIRQLAERLLIADARSTFRVAMVDGEDATESGDWTSNLDELAQQATRRSGFGSQLWESLADARSLGATTIVFITDGAATDGTDPITVPPREIAARVRTGPPTIVIGVGDVDEAGLDLLGDAGGLGAFPVADQAAAVNAVLDALAKNPEPPYRLRYVAPVTGPETRRVEVRVVGTQVLGRTTYEVPALEDRAALPALSGLYLTVKVGRWEARRVLAGIDTDNDKQVITPRDTERVHRALFGTHIIGFEASAPSVAVVLDDVSSSTLALRPLTEATTRTQRLTALAALPNIETPLLHAVTVPLSQSGDILTYEAGLRATLYRDIQIPLENDRAQRVRGVDILQVTGFMTTDPDPTTAFATTARRTARLALFEAHSFPVSTEAGLTGKQLVPAGSSISTALAGSDRRAIAAMIAMIQPWGSPRHLLVPADATPTAAWLLDSANGSVFGLLADGSGGGSDVQDIEDTFSAAEDLLSAADLAGDMASLLGFGGFSFIGGVWLQLESAKVKKLKEATLMIATLQPPAEDITDLSDLACNLAQGTAFEAAGKLAERYVTETIKDALTAVEVADGMTQLNTGEGFFCGEDESG
ncbi:twin-arginine translocation signal domain-containing protein [Micromonospora sp. DT81.3]|uniref:vWA domain-containing protein n=1 Tax=Micromonospora sp. DT81.3 TaxID=3416523 RepID=UPI003CF34E41